MQFDAHFNKLTVRLVILLLSMATAQIGLSAEDVTDGVWIDVRTVEEFNSGHVDGALNIPHTEIADRIAALVKDPYTPIHLYCRTGIRAGLALEILMEMGYQEVYNEGGYESIVAKQQP